MIFCKPVFHRKNITDCQHHWHFYEIIIYCRS